MLEWWFRLEEMLGVRPRKSPEEKLKDMEDIVEAAEAKLVEMQQAKALQVRMTKAKAAMTGLGARDNRRLYVFMGVLAVVLAILALRGCPA